MKITRHIITCVTTLGVAALVQQASAATIDLGTSASYAILGGSAITFTAPTTTINGANVGVSPGTSITAANYTLSGGAVIDNGNAASAQAAEHAAYLVAQAAPTTHDYGTAALDGLTLGSGVYQIGHKASGNLSLGKTLTLTGNASSVFIFQATSDLIFGSGSKVVLNGVNPCNVFWQVTSSVTIGSSSTIAGTFMALTSITSAGGSTINGKLFAYNGLVSLIGDTINTDQSCTPVTVPGTGGGGVPDSGSTILLLGLGLVSFIGFRTISRQSRLQAWC